MGRWARRHVGNDGRLIGSKIAPSPAAHDLTLFFPLKEEADAVIAVTVAENGSEISRLSATALATAAVMARHAVGGRVRVWTGIALKR